MPNITQPSPSSSTPLLKQLMFLFLAFLPSLLLRPRRRKVCLLKSVSYKELKKATNNFRRIITYDSEATTYEAIFSDGSVFVVKEMGNDEGNEVFFKQMQLLSRLCHRHFIVLQGYSIGHRRFLLFESAARGSLRQHLNDPLKTPLNWKIRVQIAIGVASALVYLQFFCDPPVYHVSINSNTIILDEKFAPKLTNIGHVSSKGYHIKHPEMPEEKVDLLPQFGALILELVTGQSSEKGNAGVMDWIQETTFNINMDNMIDPDLGTSYNSQELKNLLTLARICLKTEKKHAFSILHVSWYLQTMFGNVCL